MLSLRLMRQLADSALLARPVFLAPCHRRLPQCAPPTTTTRRTLISSTARHETSPACPSAPTSSHPRPRHASSSTRWKNRQGRDRYAKEAKVRGLKSRAAFKLLEVCVPDSPLPKHPPHHHHYHHS